MDSYGCRVDSKRLEDRFRVMSAGFSFLSCVFGSEGGLLQLSGFYCTKTMTLVASPLQDPIKKS